MLQTSLFTVPIDLVKIQYELTKKFNHEYNFDANQFVEKEWSFNIGEKLTVTKGETSEEGLTEIRNEIKKEMFITKVKRCRS